MRIFKSFVFNILSFLVPSKSVLHSLLVELTIAKINNLDFNWIYCFASIMRAYDSETQTYYFFLSLPSHLVRKN